MNSLANYFKYICASKLMKKFKTKTEMTKAELASNYQKLQVLKNLPQ